MIDAYNLQQLVEGRRESWEYQINFTPEELKNIFYDMILKIPKEHFFAEKTYSGNYSRKDRVYYRTKGGNLYGIIFPRPEYYCPFPLFNYPVSIIRMFEQPWSIRASWHHSMNVLLSNSINDIFPPSMCPGFNKIFISVDLPSKCIGQTATWEIRRNINNFTSNALFDVKCDMPSFEMFKKHLNEQKIADTSKINRLFKAYKTDFDNYIFRKLREIEEEENK